jgi:hypothetical protein
MKFAHMFTMIGLVSALSVGAVELSQYGLVLGGSYATLAGGDANQMGVYIDSTYLEDERAPFGYTDDTKANPTGAFGPVVGAFLRFDWNDYVYSRVELNYLWKGGEYNKTIPKEETYYDGSLDTLNSMENRSDEDEVLDGMRRWVIQTTHLEMPILVGVNVYKDLSVFVGPHISYLLGRTFDAHITESDSYKNEEFLEGQKSYTNLNVKMNTIDFGITAGIGYIVTEQFQVALRTAPGFSPILDRSKAPDITQNSLQIVASLNFSEF